MSRMSDMAQAIEELRSAAAAISDAADWLTKIFSKESQATDAPTSPPKPELTLEQVRAVLADKSRTLFAAVSADEAVSVAELDNCQAAI